MAHLESSQVNNSILQTQYTSQCETQADILRMGSNVYSTARLLLRNLT